MGIIFKEFKELYSAIAANEEISLPVVASVFPIYCMA